MAKGRIVKVTSLTTEVFTKYGKIVLLKPQQEPFIDNDDLTCWVNVMEFEAGVQRNVLLLRLKCRKMEITKMERHTKTFEWWIPLKGECLAAFAEGKNPDDPDETPDIDKVVVFKMAGLAGYVVNRGTWHWPAFPLTETAMQLVEVRKETVYDDVEIKALPEPITISV